MNAPRTIEEPARRIPVMDEVDVVVAGAGTAGVAAAVAAGRRGLSTVLVERAAQPGGMLGHVNCWTSDFENKGGLPRQFVDRLAADGVYRRPFYNPLKVVRYLDEMLADANVRPLYMAYVVDAIRDGDRVTGVVVESKEGRGAILAKVVIDATGDADVAVRAGAEYVVGRAGDGLCQPATLPMVLLNAPEGPMAAEEFNAIVARAAAERDPTYELPYERYKPRRLLGSRTAMFMMVSHAMGFDWTSARGVSDGLVELRRQGYRLHDLLTHSDSPFAGVELGPFPALPGVRETRCVVGDYTITLDDARQGRRFNDGLFTVTQDIDIHRRTPGEPSIVIEKVRPYHVCLRAMRPRGLDNLLVAGRCISGQHEAMASYRIISNCMAMGEAAAVTADLAVREGTGIRAIDPQRVARVMRDLGYAQ